MAKNMKQIGLSLMLILLLALVSGCEKKELDPHETEVMKLYLTPVPLPTEGPKYDDPKAVITQGTIKYVNEYLNDGQYVPDNLPGEETQSESEDSESNGY